MLIGTLIGIMIAIVVGISLIPTIIETTEEVAAETAETSAAAGALLNVLPIVFIVVLILGAVAWIGGTYGGKEEGETSPSERDIQKDLMAMLGEASKTFSKFINNLDIYLGIRTVNSNSVVGLLLETDGTLQISKGYHWYIVDKSKELPMFKIVGINKSPEGENLVYVLGRDEDSSMPYLIEIPKQYIRFASSGGINWKERLRYNGKARYIHRW